MAAMLAGTRGVEQEEGSTVEASPGCHIATEGKHLAGKHAQEVVDMGRRARTGILKGSLVAGDLLWHTEAPECDVGYYRGSFVGLVATTEDFHSD